MKMIPKKLLYLISVIGIVLVIIIAVGLYYANNSDTCDDNSSITGPGTGQGKSWSQNYTLLALSAIVIALLALISYYFMSKKVEKHLVENMKLISQIANTNRNDDQSESQNIEKSYKTVVLKFLNYNENRILKKIIENNGSVLQSEISRLSNMGKVKAHRILKDMEIKGIISIEKYGKTNRINLSDDVRNLFLK